MGQFLHLLKHDFVLLQRNKIVVISILVTAVYVAVFRGLTGFGNLEKVLVMVIFNDPALLGFLFVGVMVLFEKNENTLQALAVTPMEERNYILSKTIALTAISVGCCFAMAIAAYGTGFRYLEFGTAAILATVIFSFLGFLAVAGQSSFNRYMLRAVGLILLMTAPFLGYFGVTDRIWYLLFPTQPVIDLFDAAFREQVPAGRLVYGYGASLFWCILLFRMAKTRIIQNFKNQ
ncbi:MAG TPA: hypothetical protein PKB07_22715 [Flavilitoribacter sp.]|nr:hypothetical protein [Flavilitoribacter sp.]